MALLLIFKDITGILFSVVLVVFKFPNDIFIDIIQKFHFTGTSCEGHLGQAVQQGALHELAVRP